MSASEPSRRERGDDEAKQAPPIVIGVELVMIHDTDICSVEISLLDRSTLRVVINEHSGMMLMSNVVAAIEALRPDEKAFRAALDALLQKQAAATMVQTNAGRWTGVNQSEYERGQAIIAEVEPARREVERLAGFGEGES